MSCFSFKFQRFNLVLIASLLLPAAFCFAQPGTVTLGLEYKPIFPLNFLRTGTQSTTDNLGIQYSESLNSGFNGGMVIRKSFTHLLSFETGISYVKRQYTINITDAGHSESSQFQIIGYEIPFSLLIYAQTGEKTFVNASMGVSPDMFASNVQTSGDNHRSFTERRSLVQAAILANLGWEYRTEESGYFYLGASFHGPLNPEFISNIYYKQNGYDLPGVAIPLSGNYLTVDFRYFFPPDKKNVKKKDDTESPD